MSSLFGWDLLFGSVEKDIKSNQDVLVCLTHLVLVSNGFKCIGLGDSKNYDGNEAKSETLPKGWNDDYAIRYLYQGRLYNLKGTRIDDGIVINLIRVDERNVAMIQLNTRMVVKRTGLLDEMIPDNAKIVEVIKKQLIDKAVVSTKTQDSSSQTTSNENSRPNPYYQPISPLCEPRSQSFPSRPLGNPSGIGVGGADLHPFGTAPVPLGGNPLGGGGMLFVGPGTGSPMPNPGFGPNMGIPGGSLPPGARFDPFRPPDVDRFHQGPRRPDNDEFPPPGFDDMYM